MSNFFINFKDYFFILSKRLCLKRKGLSGDKILSLTMKGYGFEANIL